MLTEGGLDAAGASMSRRVDGRFVGQGYHLTVELPPGPYDGGRADDMREALREAFQRAYREKYQRIPGEVPIEFMNARVAARLALTGSALELRGDTAPVAATPKSRRRVWWHEAGARLDTPVWDRVALAAAGTQRGPAIVEEEGSTLVVGPEASFTVLASGNLVVELDLARE